MSFTGNLWKVSSCRTTAPGLPETVVLSRTHCDPVATRLNARLHPGPLTAASPRSGGQASVSFTLPKGCWKSLTWKDHSCSHVEEDMREKRCLSANIIHYLLPPRLGKSLELGDNMLFSLGVLLLGSISIWDILFTWCTLTPLITRASCCLRCASWLRSTGGSHSSYHTLRSTYGSFSY